MYRQMWHTLQYILGKKAYRNWVVVEETIYDVSAIWVFINTYCYLHFYVPFGCWECLWCFIENVQTSCFYSVYEVLINVQIIAINFEDLPFSFIHHFSQYIYLFISEDPLFVGVVFKHLKTFVDSTLNS